MLGLHELFRFVAAMDIKDELCHHNTKVLNNKYFQVIVEGTFLLVDKQSTGPASDWTWSIITFIMLGLYEFFVLLQQWILKMSYAFASL